MNLDFNTYYEKLLSYLNFDYIEFFINNDEEFSKLFQYQVFLINKSNLEYEKIDGLNNKVNKINEHIFNFTFNESFENNEDLFNEVKKINKQINKLFFDKCLINNKNIDQKQIDKKVQEVQEQDQKEVKEEPINENELTEDQKTKLRIKKYTIEEKFKYLSCYKKWYKNIRNRHIPIYIVIRKKETVKAMKEKLLKEFINLYNQEFELNFNINNLSKEFERIYQKKIVTWGYNQAIRIWIVIVGLPVLIVTLVLTFLFAGQTPPEKK